jgi:hypothetical protein
VVVILILPYLVDPLEPEPVEGGVDVDGGGVDVDGGGVDVDGGGVDVDGGGVDVDGGVNAFVVDDSGLVVVGCVEADKGADEKVGVGVARLTFIGLKVVWLGFRTNCSQDWEPPESTDAHTCAFWIWTFTGTITVTGIFTLVFVIPIRDSTGVYRFVFCVSVEKLNTALVIFALSLLLYAFGLVIGGDAAPFVPVLFPAADPFLVKSMFAPLALNGWHDCDPVGNAAQSCKSSVLALAGTVAVIGSFMAVPPGPFWRFTLTVIFLVVAEVLLVEPGVTAPCDVLLLLADFEYLMKNFNPLWFVWPIASWNDIAATITETTNKAATENVALFMLVFLKDIFCQLQNNI